MKKISVFITLIVLVFTLASCSSGTVENADASETAATDTVAPETEIQSEKFFDFSEMTIGKITKISGNQVTLELGTINEDSIEKPSAPEGASIPGDGSTPSMSEGASAPSDLPSDFDPDNMPGGFNPGDNGTFASSVTAEIEYTGETARYTIPAEVKVGNGDYTSLSKGDVIALEFDADGAVNSVMLITEKGTD